jgi:hypothetical protein
MMNDRHEGQPIEAEEKMKGYSPESGPDDSEISRNIHLAQAVNGYTVFKDRKRREREKHIDDFVKLQITAYLTNSPPLHPRR